ncbi:hypothetical protein BABINDRAFT_163314 [Babjeviella inositovora NRRL Y-12698]|uniref:Mitochondrial carrier protein n=1 Tax=Babjeviella inositovora NRRL Y-12698 TaxID=984486 RepID=A0A1E3QIQ5_9ASCO|nr:uncharacterized protein BABINDRAFT_163314 [Babjeviella inositovora NRRL Y-12698]ODQ77579.1 hypothetical protein BABINDRAFT_163314 [Babjeviella inositovora NRRL Y-12698]
MRGEALEAFHIQATRYLHQIKAFSGLNIRISAHYSTGLSTNCLEHLASPSHPYTLALLYPYTLTLLYRYTFCIHTLMPSTAIMQEKNLQFSSVFLETRHQLNQDSTASFLAGGIAGAVSRTVVSPFERAKILFQVQGLGCSTAYNGIFPTIVRMYREEGFKGLFRGNGLNCVRIFPYSAVQFATFEKIKVSTLKPGETELDTSTRLWAGGAAGVLSVLVTYPLDLVRARLSIQTASLSQLNGAQAACTKPPGAIKLLKDIYRAEGGVLGWYRGIVPTTLGVAPYVAINFAVYEKLRELIPESPSAPLYRLLSGAVAGGVAQTLIYPFDLLRRRFQVQGMCKGQLGYEYTSVMHALVSIFKKEGFFGAYKGLTANLYKVVPSMAVSWLVYDEIKDFFVHL